MFSCFLLMKLFLSTRPVKRSCGDYLYIKMINSEITTIDIGTNVGGNPTFHKQPILAAKKVALRDVQNNKSNLTPDPHPLLPVDGQPFIDTAKTVGLKRPTPDYVPPPLLTNNGSLDHFNYARRKYELGRNVGTEKITGYPRPHIQQEMNQMNGKNMHYGSVVAPNQMGSKTSFPRFKESGDEQRADRFIRLQNFIKQCDGSNHRDNIQCMLTFFFFFFGGVYLLIMLKTGC